MQAGMVITAYVIAAVLTNNARQHKHCEVA